MKVEELKMYGAALEMPKEALKEQSKIMLNAIKKKFGVFGMVGVFKDTFINQIRLKRDNPETLKKIRIVFVFQFVFSNSEKTWQRRRV